jgi:xanthine dehydrogenase accessory factor
MRELLRSLIERLNDNRPAAWCRLVETRGSTPQKAGAAMLVFPDGSQAGTLGGGCVEAEVKRQALSILESGRAQVVSFQLDSDYGWDDGLICGGRMQVLVLPLLPDDTAARRYFERLFQLLESGAGSIEAIVFDGQRSGSPAPACYLVGPQGKPAAALLLGEGASSPSGALPEAVARQLPDLASRPRPAAAHGIAVLPNLPRCRLLIVGGGPVGQAVAGWASALDFEVWVLDDRAEFANAERFPTAERLLCGPIGPTLAELDITPHTYCLIVTRGHNHDEEALYHLADRGARYVGMIGSRRKIRLIFDDLEAQGVSPEALARVYAPLGIDIGSQTVSEIAVSILAELVAHRNRQGDVPGRPAPVLEGKPA